MLLILLEVEAITRTWEYWWLLCVELGGKVENCVRTPGRDKIILAPTHDISKGRSEDGLG